MPSTKYRVVLVKPEGYVHARCFQEVAELLCQSLRSIGHDCDMAVNRFTDGCVNIVIGYQFLTPGGPLNDVRYAVWQFEQLARMGGWYRNRPDRFFDRALPVLKGAEWVWDYNTDNIAFLSAHGVRAQHLPIGYHDALMRIPQVPEADIDVLFYGAVNGRRRQVLEALDRRCRLKVLFGVYGERRDAYIARSHIVLNLHQYDRVQLLEDVRISYLLNNRRFVLSETVPGPLPYSGGIAMAPAAKLADACLAFLDDPQQRQSIAHRGWSFLRRFPMSGYLRMALAVDGNGN